MKKISHLLILLLMVSLVAVLGTWFATDFYKEKTEFSSSGVMEKFNTISELNSIEMYFNEVVDYKNAKFFEDFKVPFTEKVFVFKVEAKVKAGINLSQLEEKDITVKENSISIRLPQPKITSKEILSSKLYYEKDGLFNEVTTEDTLAALDKFMSSLEDHALKSGILEKSEENTKLQVENLLYAMGFETVQVTFQ